MSSSKRHESPTLFDALLYPPRTQVAKNVFLWHGRSYVRKALEAYFALLIELIWGKERILEVYLNVAETGKMTFGVEAAA